ncbi:MAG: GNAT family N-acetyltransferase [Armatimonadetes bacterium]|nr:GNAT family N-acetyltransferase [Armatimonadota bacterium]
MEVRTLETGDVGGVVGLQRSCFPHPFPASLLWTAEDIGRHLEVFPEGQFVALEDGRVVGSASSLIVLEEAWQRHGDWESTTGGRLFTAHDPAGSTLFGADISVHPDFRARGIGRALYEARFDLVRRLGLTRFGTACRLPDWREWSVANKNSDKVLYARAVAKGRTKDRTMTPLLRYGLSFVKVVEGHMDDEESGDAAAVLEWRP